jgi:hypothetical protein
VVKVIDGAVASGASSTSSARRPISRVITTLREVLGMERTLSP